MPSARVSSESMVTKCLERIAARDGELKAWVHVAGDAALAEARAFDKETPRSPMHGVPVGIKDVIDTADMPTEYNSAIYAGHRPRADAAAVALLRRAGCVILGKTATAEFAFRNPPATRNPRNLEHTPGGSSSGSAAAVADGMVPLALGTQTGGSVIRPASYCGVIGFKPTFGSINRTGVKPVSDSLDTVGFFASSLDAAAKALHVLSALPLVDLSLKVSAPRIGFARTSRWSQVDASSHESLEAAAKKWAAAGAIVVDVPLSPAIEALFVEQGHIMKYEAARALAWEQDKHRDLLSAGIRERLAEGWAVTRERYDLALHTAGNARRQFADQMRSFDLLLTLAAPGEAPKGLTSTGEAIFNGLWTLLGVPCITLPGATGALGLPIGVQLVGSFGEDTALLARARWAERILAAA